MNLNKWSIYKNVVLSDLKETGENQGCKIISYLNSNSGNVETLLQTILDILFREYVFKGNWDQESNYSVMDIVFHNNKFYECSFENINIEPNNNNGGVPWRIFSGGRVGKTTAQSQSAFSVHEVLTKINRHAFEDYSRLQTTDTNLGYGCFDARATMLNSLPQAHFFGLQGRQIFAGSAALGKFAGVYCRPEISPISSGVVSNFYAILASSSHDGPANVSNLTGLYIKEDEGSGSITNNYGIFLENRTKGTNNYGIYQVVGSNCINTFGAGRNDFFGSITSKITSFAIGYGNDTSGKVISLGYSFNGTSNAGKITIFDGKNNELTNFEENKISFNKKVNYASYTVSSLPSGENGSIVYCSNALKIGETTGNGTGAMVYYSQGYWRLFSTDAIVSA